MIRRDTSDRWLLIAQTEHARLSGELAAAWAAPPLSRAAVFAIGHHDDGWLEWEARPRTDEETGRPLDFTETSREDHIAIWTRGPEAIAEVSPYGGLLVSHHGTGLAETKLRLSGTLSFEQRAALRRYLEEQEAFRRRIARKAGLALDSDEIARDVVILRLLDYLSLVLCCGPATTRRIEIDGAALDLVARDQRSVTVAPWPFGDDRFELAAGVEAVSLPKQRFDDRSLAAALRDGPREELVFHFIRG